VVEGILSDCSLLMFAYGSHARPSE